MSASEGGVNKVRNVRARGHRISCRENELTKTTACDSYVRGSYTWECMRDEKSEKINRPPFEPSGFGVIVFGEVCVRWSIQRNASVVDFSDIFYDDGNRKDGLTKRKTLEINVKHALDIVSVATIFVRALPEVNIRLETLRLRSRIAIHPRCIFEKITRLFVAFGTHFSRFVNIVGLSWASGRVGGEKTLRERTPTETRKRPRRTEPLPRTPLVWRAPLFRGIEIEPDAGMRLNDSSKRP